MLCVYSSGSELSHLHVCECRMQWSEAEHMYTYTAHMHMGLCMGIRLATYHT